MGRPNYKADKRRKEIERQKKQEAKREKRLNKTRDENEDVVVGENADNDEQSQKESE